MYKSDIHILRLIDYLKFEKKVSSTSDFCSEIKMQKQNISKIKKGTSHFTVQNIETICKKYNVNANWVFGIDSKVFNHKNSVEINII